MSKKDRVVYIKENTLDSMVTDAFTFGSIVGSFWFNYKFIDGNNWLDVLLFIAFFMLALGRAGNFRKLKELEDKEFGPQPSKGDK